MWQVFPKVLLTKIIFFLFTVLFLSILSLIFNPDNFSQLSGWGKFSAILKLVTPVTLVFIGVIYALGKWGWKPLWKAPKLGKTLNTTLCPDLNGTWQGETKSNFKSEEVCDPVTPVTLEIKADMFGFDITLPVPSNAKSASSSKVMQCEVFKDPRTKHFYLYYLFEGNVIDPEDTDDSVYYGAAKLEVIFQSDGNIQLQGPYWTNRAWQRHKNTAGIITVSRKDPV